MSHHESVFNILVSRTVAFAFCYAYDFNTNPEYVI